ncbi:hypothetical protein LOK49_LG06G02276 [Camellia lanceoleosa]|uniref:Uncharacterized protein n=1 Tax=Camellia lanceoleosa TaxID=1840588 RepID=A0ACC0HCQ5_9ERIC|nr:hypothetical protein LOK49_LG06G02276 [Camellia lanceoleosa]
MDSMSRTTISVTSALSLYLHVPTPAHSTRMPVNTTPYKLVNEFCNQAKNKTFCVETYKLDPRSALAPDQVTLVKVAIDLGINDDQNSRVTISCASQARYKPHRKASSSKLRIFTRRGVRFLRGALKFVSGPYDEDSYETASENILNAGYSVESCQRGLDSKGVRDPSISRVVTSTSRVIGFAFRITNNVPTPTS